MSSIDGRYNDTIRELAQLATKLKLTEFYEILINIQATSDEQLLNDEFYQYTNVIANIENISQAQVSRIRAKLLKKLKDKYDGGENNG